MGEVIPINRDQKVRPKKMKTLTEAQRKRLRPIYKEIMKRKLKAKLREMKAKKT